MISLFQTLILYNKLISIHIEYADLIYQLKVELI